VPAAQPSTLACFTPTSFPWEATDAAWVSLAGSGRGLLPLHDSFIRSE
jgi:hypothetical protein